MKVYICDIEGCEKHAEENSIPVCVGWLNSTWTKYKIPPKKTFKPFESPDIRRMDLCKEHLREWCKATFQALFPIDIEK